MIYTAAEIQQTPGTRGVFSSKRVPLRLRCAAVVSFVVVLVPAGWLVAARQTSAVVPRDLIGTWRLVSLERADASQPLAAVPNPIGILIQDV